MSLTKILAYALTVAMTISTICLSVFADAEISLVTDPADGKVAIGDIFQVKLPVENNTDAVGAISIECRRRRTLCNRQ